MTEIQIDVQILDNLIDVQNTLKLAWELFSTAGSGEPILDGACTSMCDLLNQRIVQLNADIELIRSMRKAEAASWTH